jgi:hypothetical protein
MRVTVLGEGRASQQDRFTVGLALGFTLANFNPDFVEHTLPPQSVRDAFGFVLSERTLGVGARYLKEPLVQHHDPQRAKSKTWRDRYLTQIVNTKAARLFDPIFDKGVAQGVLRLNFVEVTSFNYEAILESFVCHRLGGGSGLMSKESARELAKSKS